MFNFKSWCLSYKFKQYRNMSTFELSFICHVVSDSLRPHGLQLARLPCPSPSPSVCSNPCPSSQWSHPTISSSPLSSCLQSFPASGFFPNESVLHQVTKVLEFQLQHQSFQWYSELISFRIDWFDLFAVQRALKSLLQHHSSKSSIIVLKLEIALLADKS